MSLTDIDGFDHYNDTTELARKGWTVFSNSAHSIAFSQSPRFSGYSIAFVGGESTLNRYIGISRTFLSTQSEPYFGIAVNVSSVNNLPFLVSFIDSSTYQIGIRINTDWTLSVIRGGVAGTVLSTSVKQLSPSTWYHISGEFKISGSVGTAKLWLNGELLLDLTGLNTQQSANAYATGISVYDNIVGGASLYIDDLYVGNTSGVTNTSCPTEARVTTLYPTANGTLTGWSFSGTANAWQAVSDANPDNDTSYIYSNVSGTKSTFTFGDLETDADSVFGLQFVNYGRKDDADIRATRFLMGMPSGTVYEYGTGSYMGSSYQYFTNILEVDPITSGSLTPTIVNNNEYGIVTSI